MELGQKGQNRMMGGRHGIRRTKAARVSKVTGVTGATGVTGVAKVPRVARVPRVTRVKDQRYQKNEKAIMSAFFGAKPGVKVPELAKKSGVSRATIYRHHKGTQAVMPDIEQRMLEDFEDKVVRLQGRKRVCVRVMYYKMLTFIYQNRQEFALIVKKGDERAIEEMVVDLLPGVMQRYKIPLQYDEVIRIYEKEVMAVVETWIIDDFSTSEMGVLNDIMYLTHTVKERLVKIGR